MSNPFDAAPAAPLDRITPSAPAAAGAPASGVRSLDEAVTSGGAPSLFTKHSKIGDSGGGPIIDAEVQHMRDFTTGALLYWEDGNKREQVVVRVKTELRDPAKPSDDGTRGVYIKTWGPQLKALREAITAAGYTTASEALAPGNHFYGQLVGEQPSPVRGGDAEKLYQYVIQGSRDEAARQAGVLTSAPAQPTAQPPF